MLAAFLLYLRRFFEPMQELSQFYNSLQSATAALEKLAGVLDEQPAVPEPAQPAPLPAGPAGARSTFDAVTLRLPPGPPVLPELDLPCRPARPWRWSARPARASRPSRSWSPGSTTRSPGTVRLDGVDLRDLADADLRRASSW